MKLSVLRAIRRVLKRDGRFAGYTIALPTGLDDSQRALGIDAGPEHVAAESSYHDMLRRAGFSNVGVTDVADEYAATAAAWHREWNSEAADLTELLGHEEFEERQSRRLGAVTAIGARALTRYLLTAHAPG